MEKKEISFEEDLAKLEEIVKRLETGETPLDDAIDQFKEAMTIAKRCDSKLKNAEESIHKILNEDGTITDFQVNES